jgi:precorrin-3B synthase
MNAPSRRGACPALSAPMLTGDGLLARIRPKAEITLDALIALCRAASQHGNGVIEISARGSVQVRGLNGQSASLFAAEITNLDIVEVDGVPIITDPLPQDPEAVIDSASIAAGLREAIGDARLALSHKVSIALDGGGRLHLDALTADIRLRAIDKLPEPQLHVALGGDGRSATALGTIKLDSAADILIRLLSVIAAHGPTARAADILDRHGLAPFSTAVTGQAEAALVATRQASSVIGKHALRGGGGALGIVPAFGQTDAEALAQLADAAADCGARRVRAAPGRALLFRTFAENKADALAAAAEDLGFIVRATDPRRRVVACSGRPACAAGLIAARALAAEVSRHLASGDDDIAVHISGCSKGCAHPKPAPVTMVGHEHGCGIVHHGSARDRPQYYVDATDVLGELTRAEALTRQSAHA